MKTNKDNIAEKPARTRKVNFFDSTIIYSGSTEPCNAHTAKLGL